MAVAISIVNIDDTKQQFIIDGTLTLTGNYGGASTHGDTISFGLQDQIKSQQVPNMVVIYEVPTAGNAPTGYTYLYGQGTTMANGVLIVLQTGTASNPQVEITANSAYPAALTAATANLRFRAWFPSFL